MAKPIHAHGTTYGLPAAPNATVRVTVNRTLSEWDACASSGGANGKDARGTRATNVKRRNTNSNPLSRTRIAQRPDAAKRAPKVTAARPDRADLTGTRNPRKVTNPGNKPKRVVRRAHVPVQLVPNPKRERPLRMAIY